MDSQRGFDRRKVRLRRRVFLGGLSLAGASLLIACGTIGSPQTSGSATSTGAGGAAGSTAAVKMTDDNKFDPATVTITKGGTVTWTNSSSMIHTVTDDPAKAVKNADAQLPAGAQPWDAGLLQPGQTFTHTFDVAGTYKYFCIPHEALGMLGTVVVQ